MPIAADQIRSVLSRWIADLQGEQLLAVWRFHCQIAGKAAPQPAPDGWIPVHAAARDANLDPGHLARLCRRELAAAGHARLTIPRSGGKPTWHISAQWLAARRQATATRLIARDATLTSPRAAKSARSRQDLAASLDSSVSTVHFCSCADFITSP